MAKTELFARYQSGGVFTIVNEMLTTGNIFFVHSGTGTDSAGGGNNPDKPLASIDYAVGLCTANKKDRIVVMPGHTETVASAAALALDVAGIEVIGLGNGSNRPTVNVTATGGYVGISAANVKVSNILFTGGVDAITKVISISAADVLIENCEYRDVTGQCTDCILTTAAADRLRVSGFRYDGDSSAGTNAAIAIVGGDRIRIENSQFDGNFAVGVVDVRTTATTDLEITNVVARTRNAADIFLVDTITGSTGMIGPNLYLRLNDNAANITEACTGATFVYLQPISIVNLAGESSMFTNITASTDA